MITQYKVEGMTCEHCVNAVTEEVSAVPGADAVQIDLAGGVVSVQSSAPLDYDVVSAAVDEAGYKLVKQL
jgi:copper chaperone CopZ